MGRASASMRVPGLASDAEALWYDPLRWPAWIDGFGHVVELPERRGRPSGAARLGRRRRGGRGRVLETVIALRAARRPDASRSRTAACAAPSRSSFEPGRRRGARSRSSLEYELKERTPLTPLVDLLFVRRAIAASLRRTLDALRPRAARRHGVGGA